MTIGVSTPLRIDVEAVNRRFPRFPVTIEDKGWIYGVWYCGTPRRPARLHGVYPQTFLARALALFPDAERILHVPSGTLRGHGGQITVDRIGGQITVDRIVDGARRPDIQADAAALPFRGGAFDLVLCDPPYSPADSAIYGTQPFRQMAAMREFRRVLRPGGMLGFLHTYYPAYRRDVWGLRGLIAVVTGFQRATRIFSILERLDVGERPDTLFEGPPRKINGARTTMDRWA